VGARRSSGSDEFAARGASLQHVTRREEKRVLQIDRVQLVTIPTSDQERSLAFRDPDGNELLMVKPGSA
jgi:hypothetical protein